MEGIHGSVAVRETIAINSIAFVQIVDFAARKCL